MFAASVKNILLKTILVSYDIICQWGVHFWERLEHLPEHLHLSVDADNLILLIPKFHLPAHQTACQAPYSYNFQRGAGNGHGETIEENWSQSNKASAQTKEMGPGSRQDTLDDIFGYHNWMTLTSLERTIKKRMVLAVKSMELHRELFDRFDTALRENLGEAVVDGWEKEVKDWESDHDLACPYESTVKGKLFFYFGLLLC